MEAYPTLTVSLNVDNAREAIAFYEKAFGAEKTMMLEDEEGNVMHVEMKIGDTPFFFSESIPEMGALSAKEAGASPTLLCLHIPEVDAAFNRAVEAGCEVLMPVMDMPWGDRCGSLRDPYGYRWNLSMHVEDVPQEEVVRRMKNFNFGG